MRKVIRLSETTVGFSDLKSRGNVSSFTAGGKKKPDPEDN